MTADTRAEPSVTGRAGLLELVREHAWAIAVWVGMACWTATLFAIVWRAYVNFDIGRFDLGNMVQAVWSTAHGHPLETTNAGSGEQMVRLGSHVDPFLVLLTPVWFLWSSPVALAFAQIVVVSLGALPVFWLGRRHLCSERAAGLLALAYLAYPWVATSAASVIHPVTFGITFYLYSVWFLDTRRLAPFAVCAGLAMSTGELMGVPVAALGLWYALARRERRVGAVVAVAGLTWTVIAIYVIVPAFAGGDSVFYGFYDEVGGSPLGVLRMLAGDPGTLLTAVSEARDIAYVLWLGLPLLFLFTLSPGLAAVAIPQLLANGLSDFRSMTDPRYHSVAALIPFLVAATVLGVARLRVSVRAPAAAAVLVCSATIAMAVGPWPRVAGVTPLGGLEGMPAARARTLGEAATMVPAGVPVTVSNQVGSHLSARRYLYSIPNLGRSTWAVVDLRDPWVVVRNSPILVRRPGVVAAFARRLERDARWTRVFERDRVLVFRRVRT